jgi:hypothetical protein
MARSTHDLETRTDSSVAPRSNESENHETNARSFTGFDNGEEPRRVSILRTADGANPEQMEYQQFADKARNDTQELFDGICQAYKALLLDLRDEKLTTESLAARINELTQTVENKEQAMMELIDERDRYKHVAEYMETRQGRSTSPEAGVGGDEKGLKLPDVPVLTDGKNPRFDDWLSLMKRRFGILGRSYPTEEHKIAYIQTRLGGKALEYVSPRFRESCSRPYHTVDEIYRHLKSVFHNPNRVQEALDRFRNLEMKTSQKYHDFLAVFSHQAGEADVPESTYKRELYSKITPALRSLTWSQYGDINVTFEEFSNLCATAAYTLQLNHSQESKTSTRATTVTPGHNTTSKPVTTATGTNNTAPRKRLDEAEKAELTKDGKCFYCKEQGHIVRDCPKMKAKAELKALEKPRTTVEADKEEEAGKASP